jgi:hypothetical protein
MNPLRLVLAPVRGAVSALRRTRRTVAIVPDALEAILVLPALSRQLEEIRFSTATLPEMLEELRRVQADTSALPPMCEEISRMEETVAAVERNTLVFGRFAGRVPQLRNGRGPERTVT